jgi:hypothetical protein
LSRSRKSPKLGSVHISAPSVGAVAAAIGLVWTLLLPVLALVLVVLSFLHARELARAPQPTT